MSSQGPNTAFNSPLPGVQRDRREFPRIMVQWKAVVQSPGDPVNVRVIEISDVGFGFVCDVAYPIGAELSFQLNLPDPNNGGQWHLVPGRADVMSSVLGRDGFRSGVTVKSVSSSHQEMLKAWVKIRLRE